MSSFARGARLTFLGAAVALAFADSSIVVLALPELLRRFDTSIEGVAWVITSYNLVVAAVALVLVRVGRRIDPARLARCGLIVFLGASLACAFAPSLWPLVAFRSAQGLGAACLLAGSLPLARAWSGDPARGTARWALAGAFGAALGPAAGGALTEAFDWRAIFLAQAPIAAIALLATVGAAPAAALARGEAIGRLRRLGANVALALVSGALVGALFLVVVLLIEVWGYSPLRAAAVVSAIPAGTLAARWLGRRPGSATAGALLVAAGLAAVALVPASGVVWVVAGLALCGAGLGLTVPAFTHSSGDWSVASRHVGLVAALLLLTPLLAHDLATGTTRAEEAGTALVLDSGLPLGTKAPLAGDLVRRIKHTPRGSLPDFGPDFARRGDSPALGGLERSLEGTIRAVATSSFRRAFLLCALLALPVAALGFRRRGASDTVLLGRGLRLALGLGCAVLALELAAGGLSYGHVAKRDPCRAPATVSGDGWDPFAQRLVLRGVDKAACELRTSREQLVLDLAEKGDKAQRWVTRVFG